MAFSFTLLSPPTLLSPHYNQSSLKTRHPHHHRRHLLGEPFRRLPAIGVEKFQQIHCQAARDSKVQEEDFRKNESDLEESNGKINEVRIVEPKFKMSLDELLDDSKVVPLSVYGDLGVQITGIQHDSTVVSAGDLFVCCIGSRTDGHLYINEVDKRGAVAVIATASFYRYPSKNMAVIGITGTNAVAVGIAVGADSLEDIGRGIEKVDAVPGRCEVIDEGQAFGVIVDYAHTPDAVYRLLDFVRELAPKRIITVLGCGGDRDQWKRPTMAKISTDKSEVTILTSDNPRSEDPLDILDDMLAGVGRTMQDYLKYEENDYYPPLPNGHQLFVHSARRVAIRSAVAMGKEGDMIVIAGKGHETYLIQGDKKEFFDDREECRDALKYVNVLRQAG
ncbi:hypothetical protein V6Z11_D03G176200 [Gossypium hirsutum]